MEKPPVITNPEVAEAFQELQELVDETYDAVAAVAKKSIASLDELPAAPYEPSAFPEAGWNPGFFKKYIIKREVAPKKAVSIPGYALRLEEAGTELFRRQHTRRGRTIVLPRLPNQPRLRAVYMKLASETSDWHTSIGAFSTGVANEGHYQPLRLHHPADRTWTTGKDRYSSAADLKDTFGRTYRTSLAIAAMLGVGLETSYGISTDIEQVAALHHDWSQLISPVTTEQPEDVGPFWTHNDIGGIHLFRIDST